MADDTRDRTGPLSDRQRTILAMLAEGKTHSQVAAQLGMGRTMVANTLARSILPKLGCYRTIEAVARYVKAQTYQDAASYLEANGLDGDAMYFRDLARRTLP